MNFDSSSKIIINNSREAQSFQEKAQQFGQNALKSVSKNTTPSGNLENDPAKSFLTKLLENVRNLGQDSDSVKDLLLKRINIFTNLRLVLNDSEIIDYFQKFVDGADIPIEETLDLFALAYDANMKIGKNIREILEFILNHRTWNRNPELTKDIVEKTVSLATSTSTRFFPYFSMLLSASDPGSKDLSSIGMIGGLDVETQQAFRELVNLAAKTDKDSLEAIRIQSQLTQDKLEVAKDKYSLTRGIVEALEKSSYNDRLSKTILKLDQLFRKRYSRPGYRKIKLMMFDLHFGQQIYENLFADLKSSTALQSRNPRSSRDNLRVAFQTLYSPEQIESFTQQDIKFYDDFFSSLNYNIQPKDKQKLANLIAKVKSDIISVSKNPQTYNANYVKVMNNFIQQLENLKKQRTSTSQKFSKIVLAAPPPSITSAITSAISSALGPLASLPGIGPTIAAITAAITAALPAGISVASAQWNLFIKTVTDGISALASFNSTILNIPTLMNAIANNNVLDIQKELNKLMNGEQLADPASVEAFFNLLKLTALINRDFSSVVSLLLTHALYNRDHIGQRPLPIRKVTPQERVNIEKTLGELTTNKAIINAITQLKDFRQQTIKALDDEKALAETFKDIQLQIPGVTFEAPILNGKFESSTKNYYDDLSKAIKMFNYELQTWKSLDKYAKPDKREALSVFLKANVSEIEKDILIVTKKLGEVYLLGIGNNAQVDVNIRKLEQENIVNKGLFDAEKTQGVQVPLSSIALRENIVEQRAEYDKLLTSASEEYKYLQSAEATANITGDYIAAIDQVEKMLGKPLIDAKEDPQAIKQEINIRMSALAGIIENLKLRIINLTNDIINTSEGTRTSMSKFEKIVKDNNELPEKKDSSEIIKEADEVTEDYWNELLPGFGSAMEKPKKWRKKLTEDIPVVMHHTRKWTY